MALLNKFFNNRRKTLKTAEPDFFNSSRWIAPDFNKNRIRVLVFRECEVRGRKLLFDLDSIKKIDLSSQSECQKSHFLSKPPSSGSCSQASGSKSGGGGHIEMSPNGIGYQYLRPRSDVKMLGEMIFGSVAMSYKGAAIKIHSIRSSSQLMFSKVFSAPLPSSRIKNDSDDSCSLQSSLNDSIPKPPSEIERDCLAGTSVPVNVPAKNSLYHSDDDLEWLTSSSLKSSNGLEAFLNVANRSPDSTSSLSSLTRSGSYNSLQRRWIRTQNTSMEFGIIKRNSNDSVSSCERQFSSSSRTKLGVSVIITVGNNEEEEKPLQTFFFSHIALIESYVNKLCVAVELAYANRKQFVHSVMEGTENLQKSLCDLYTAPRILEPVWLSLMTRGTFDQTIQHRFIKELTSLLSPNDSKNTNFFMSTLLTAVLTHHLAWVSTVTPSDILPNQSFYAKHTAKWLDMLAKLHPYNPLWVQLGDMYGALGNPCIVSRTVIVGSNAELVSRILKCLTYFIRCCEVSENVEARWVSKSNSQSISSTSSGGTLVGDNTANSYLCSEPGEGAKSKPETSPLAIPNSPNVNNSYHEGNLVARQDGEGENEDDEVFFNGIKDMLRTKSTCSNCSGSCSCRNVNRNGIIGDIDKAEDIRIPLSRVGTENGQLYNLITPIRKENDSGIDFNIDADEMAKVQLVFNKENGHSKSKRKGSNGKVVFTIGNVPLEELYNSSQRDDSKDALVCTCGKHVAVPGTKNTDLFCANNKLDREQNVSFINCSAFNTKDSERFTDANSRCDSGIQSCDQSIVDFIERSSVYLGTNSVEELRITIPPVKVEHVKNVGTSLDVNKSVHPKSARTFNYERTNSMFDEYFDENVELKTLDEESFQQKLKIKRDQQRSGKDNFTKFVAQTSTNVGQIDSRGGPLQRREDQCHSVISSLGNATTHNENVRKVLWNSQLPNVKDNDFIDKVLELPMPKSDICYSINNSSDYNRGFGWSLAANYTDHYMSDFALQGTSQTDFGHQLLSDLKMAVSSPLLDETVVDAVAIIADTDNWIVQTVTSKHGSVSSDGAPVGTRVMMSQLVAGITDSLLQLWNLEMSSEFCLMHLEDRLQELYFKSRLLSEYTATMQHVDIKSIVHALGVDPSDLPLLLAISSIHSPQNGNT